MPDNRVNNARIKHWQHLMLMKNLSANIMVLVFRNYQKNVFVSFHIYFNVKMWWEGEGNDMQPRSLAWSKKQTRVVWILTTRAPGSSFKTLYLGGGLWQIDMHTAYLKKHICAQFVLSWYHPPPQSPSAVSALLAKFTFLYQSKVQYLLYSLSELIYLLFHSVIYQRYWVF